MFVENMLKGNKKGQKDVALMRKDTELESEDQSLCTDGPRILFFKESTAEGNREEILQHCHRVGDRGGHRGGHRGGTQGARTLLHPRV